MSEVKLYRWNLNNRKNVMKYRNKLHARANTQNLKTKS